MTLERMPMSRTSPDVSPTVIVSPTWNGRSNSRISPDTKFVTTLCRPRPAPTPIAPASTVTLFRSIPEAPTASRNPVNRIV